MEKIIHKNIVDETGKIYGRWTVLEFSHSNGRNLATWRCKCICGKEAVVVGHNLRNGSSRSCGCINKEKLSLSYGEASFNKMLCSMKSNAKKAHHSWSLTKDQVRELTSQRCYYCNVLPKQKINYTEVNGVYLYNGLDRVDSSKGYTIDNVVPCCKKCNQAKNNMTIDQFSLWVYKVYKNFCVNIKK